MWEQVPVDRYGAPDIFLCVLLIGGLRLQEARRPAVLEVLAALPLPHLRGQLTICQRAAYARSAELSLRTYLERTTANHPADGGKMPAVG